MATGNEQWLSLRDRVEDMVRTIDELVLHDDATLDDLHAALDDLEQLELQAMAMWRLYRRNFLAEHFPITLSAFIEDAERYTPLANTMPAVGELVALLRSLREKHRKGEFQPEDMTSGRMARALWNVCTCRGEYIPPEE